MSRRAGLNHQDVVALAVRLADADGLEALSATTLATQLGIRTPSLYNHIVSLDGLRQELAVLGMRELTERIGRAAMGKSGDIAMYAVLNAYRGYIKEHPGVYSATVRSSRLVDPPDPALQEVEGRLLDVILAVLSAYSLSPDQTVHTARALRSLVHGFATIENGHGFGIALDIDASFRYMLDLFIAGLHQRMNTG